jgi:hypothetical protein
VGFCVGLSFWVERFLEELGILYVCTCWVSAIDGILYERLLHENRALCSVVTDCAWT